MRQRNMSAPIIIMEAGITMGGDRHLQRLHMCAAFFHLMQIISVLHFQHETHMAPKSKNAVDMNKLVPRFRMYIYVSGRLKRNPRTLQIM